MEAPRAAGSSWRPARVLWAHRLGEGKEAVAPYTIEACGEFGRQ